MTLSVLYLPAFVLYMRTDGARNPMLGASQHPQAEAGKGSVHLRQVALNPFSGPVPVGDWTEETETSEWRNGIFDIDLAPKSRSLYRN